MTPEEREAFLSNQAIPFCFAEWPTPACNAYLERLLNSAIKPGAQGVFVTFRAARTTYVTKGRQDGAAWASSGVQPELPAIFREKGTNEDEALALHWFRWAYRQAVYAGMLAYFRGLDPTFGEFA